MLGFDDLHSSALLILNATSALLCLLCAGGKGPLSASAFEPEGMRPASSMADLERRRESAVSAKRAKCEFLADMGHQLRTPMNAVIGYSEMLLEDLFAAGQQSPELAKVHELGQLVLSRTNDVLDLAKMEMGRLPLFVEKISLQQLSSNLDSTLSLLADGRGNRCDLRLGNSTDLIALDARKTRQLVQQVFSVVNDIAQGERICIHLRLADKRLVCSVLADGRAPARAVFHEIFRGDGPSDKIPVDRQSAGLAMALSRQLAALLGGHVALVEEKSAAGFAIELPLTDEDAVISGEAAHIGAASY